MGLMVQAVKRTDKTLGQRIAEAREKKDMTQEDLWIKSRVPRRTIQNIEYDKVSPRLDNLVALARALDMPINEMVGEDGFARSKVVGALARQSQIEALALAARFLDSMVQATDVRRAIVQFLLEPDERHLEGLAPKTAQALKSLVRAL